MFAIGGLVLASLLGCKSGKQNEGNPALFTPALKDGPGFLSKASDRLFNFDTPITGHLNILSFNGGTKPYKFQTESCAQNKAIEVKSTEENLLTISATHLGECKIQAMDAAGNELEIAVYAVRSISGRSNPVHSEAAPLSSSSLSSVGKSSAALSSSSSSYFSSSQSSSTTTSSSSSFSSNSISLSSNSVITSSISLSPSTSSSSSQSPNFLPSAIAVSSSSAPECALETGKYFSQRFNFGFGTKTGKIGGCSESVLAPFYKFPKANSCAEALSNYPLFIKTISSTCNPAYRQITNCVEAFQYSNPGLKIDPAFVEDLSPGITCIKGTINQFTKDPDDFHIKHDLVCKYNGPIHCEASVGESISTTSTTLIPPPKELVRPQSENCEMQTNRHFLERWNFNFFSNKRTTSRCAPWTKTSYEAPTLASCNDANFAIMAHLGQMSSNCNPKSQLPTNCVESFQFRNPDVYIDPAFVSDTSPPAHCRPNDQNPKKFEIQKILNCDYTGPITCKKSLPPVSSVAIDPLPVRAKNGGECDKTLHPAVFEKIIPSCSSPIGLLAQYKSEANCTQRLQYNNPNLKIDRGQVDTVFESCLPSTWLKDQHLFLLTLPCKYNGPLICAH